jgi:hypothetical protein
MPRFTACAVRAAQVWGWATRSGPLATTAVRVSGASRPPADQQAPEGPWPLPPGESQAKRPDLPPGGRSTRWGDRAVPRWGHPADGQASETTVHHPLVAAIAPVLAKHGGAPGAASTVAEAALVAEAQRAALGETRGLPRVPAPSHAGARLSAAAGAPHPWDARGGIAPPPPRPAPAAKACEGAVTLEGTPERAGVRHASAPDKRRPPRLARARPAASRPVRRGPSARRRR